MNLLHTKNTPKKEYKLKSKPWINKNISSLIKKCNKSLFMKNINLLENP